MNHLGPIALASALLAGCGGTSVAELGLSRVLPRDPNCGIATDGATVVVRALGEFPASPATAFAQPLDGTDEFRIADFPAETTAIAVEVLGADGEPRAVGKSAPLSTGIGDADVAIMMLPYLGACEVTPMARARARPQAVPLAGGALVFGGIDAEGPVLSVEWYDPSTARFENRGDELYGTESEGMVGATAAALPDGGIVVTGGPQTAWQRYFPDGSVAGIEFLSDVRAFHSAVALDVERVLLAGGCAGVASDLSCAEGGLSTSSILNIVSGDIEVGPSLQEIRIGGTAHRLSADEVLLVGGVDDDGNPAPAERLSLTQGSLEISAGVFGPSIQLSSGAVISGFAPSGTPPVADAALTGALPGSGSVVIPSATPRSGARFEIAEDGTVLLFGGGGVSSVSSLSPLSRRFDVEDVELGGTRRDHAAVRMPDGSVLVVGGVDVDGQPREDAWLYRPSLRGPRSPDDLSVRFTAAGSTVPVSPSDGTRVFVETEGERTSLVIEGAPVNAVGPAAYAVIPGPVYRRGRAQWTGRADVGVALLVAFRAPDAYHYARLVPGQRAELVRVTAQGSEELSCGRRETVTGADIGGVGESRVFDIELTTSTLTVRIDEREVLRCEEVDLEAGGFGFGALGDEGRVAIDTATLTR